MTGTTPRQISLVKITQRNSCELNRDTLVAKFIMKKTVMVLGAGMSGLCAAKRALEHDFSVTVYEKADQIGGLWYYKDDDPDHVCTYEDLVTNQPRQVMEFIDFHYPFDKLYFGAKEVQDYLIAYAKKFKVDKFVQFNQQVIHVEPQPKDKAGGWVVTVKNTLTQQFETKQFDFVVIANGHYNTPRYPDIKGIELFKGEQIHSVAYRKKGPYAGRKVLVIGSGLSAMDIMWQLTSVCSKVYFSQRTGYSLDFEMPENLEICPVVQELTETEVIFVEHKRAEVDAIIYATGYNYDFPFLSMSCGIHVEENHIHTLYKHIINVNHPTMSIIGMPFYILPQLLFDLQSEFCMQFWSGKKLLPSPAEMLKDANDDFQQRLDLGWGHREAHKMQRLSMQYHDELAEIAELKKTPIVFHELINHFAKVAVKDFRNYRKDRYEIIDEENFTVCRKDEVQ